MNLRVPSANDELVRFINDVTVGVNIELIMINVYNTILLDKESFIQTGNVDFTLYEDVIKDITSNLGTTNMNVTYDNTVTVLVQLLSKLTLQFLNSINGLGLINKEILVEKYNVIIIDLKIF